MTEIKGSKLKVSFGALTDMDAGVHNWSSTSGVTGNVLGYPVVFDIQYCYIYIYLHKSQSLIIVARVHSTIQPFSSNQWDAARLESKLTRCSNHVHLIT
jgi:hypothetical protein